MADVAENWPRDADDLVNGIPEEVKAAKSLGHVPAAGNEPERQRGAAKMLEGLGIEVPDGVQSGPVTPADRRDAVRRQNEYAEEKAADLVDADTPNPVQLAHDAENPDDAKNRAEARSKDDAAAARRDDKSATAATVRGRSATPPKATT